MADKFYPRQTDYIDKLNEMDDSYVGASGDAAAAASSAAAALISEGLADADATQTALDKIATNADVVLTHADVVLTHADVALTNADVVTTNDDAATTTQDAIDTAADAAQTALDKIATNADVVLTNADVVTCGGLVAGVNIPAVTSGDVGKTLLVNAAEDGYDLVIPIEGVTDHTLLSNIGTNTHTQIDTKLNHITVTQSVNLDTIESDTVTNNAKISFDSTSSTRLADTSGTNTGDNATNTQYSSLVSNVDHPLVETAVPVGAIFTDTLTNQTITLSGDVSGSGTTSISVVVADDSHNHITSNVDGLDTALTAKLEHTNGTTTGLYETVVAVPALNIDFSAGNVHTKTISVSSTFTFSGLSSGKSSSTTFSLTTAGTETIGYTGVTWDSGSAPTNTAAGTMILIFYSVNGTSVRGSIVKEL